MRVKIHYQIATLGAIFIDLLHCVRIINAFLNITQRHISILKMTSTGVSLIVGTFESFYIKLSYFVVACFNALFDCRIVISVTNWFRNICNMLMCNKK